MSALWRESTTIIEFSIVNALFALSTFVALWGGVLSLAAAPFAAVTGYTTLVLMMDHDVSFGVVLVVGFFLGIAVAYLVGLPILRLETHWVALSTIALVLIARVIALNLGDLTGGAQGRTVLRVISTWHLVAALLLTSWVLYRHRRSRLGLAIESVRGEPAVAETLGVDVIATRQTVFLMSGAIAGVSGVLYAQLVQFVSPSTFYVSIAFIMLASTVLGGAYFWLGPIVGAFVFTVLPETLRIFLPTGEQIVNGIILILVMIYLPKGLIEPGRKERREGLKAAAASAQLSKDSVGDDELDEPSDLGLTGRTKRSDEALDDQTDLSSNAEPAVEIRSLVKSYGGFVAVNELDLTIPTGSVFGILGPNGAGKSTLVNIISGLESPDSGRIIIAGRDITDEPSYVTARSGLARTFQTVRLFENLTVLENIASGFYRNRVTNFVDPIVLTQRERRERREIDERARALMDRVGVIGRPDQPAATLSYANQRRIEIARALATGPKILLLDEPTAGMHKHGSEAVGELLLDLQDQGLTIIVVEHNMQLILDYCDLTAVMNFGELLCLGTPDKCLEDAAVREAYFGNREDAERIQSILKLRER